MIFGVAVQVQMTKNGISCKAGIRTVNLDPKRASEDAINFVSHAHMDHLPSRNGGAILASEETSQISALRGFEMNRRTEQQDGFEMIDSGHILGARGLLFDDVFYTGDICTRDRGFLRAARIPQCKTLITECTFGLPEFEFPSLDEIKSRVNDIVSGLYSQGTPVILMGYQLGKAQTLCDLFRHWDPLFYHDSVKEMNDLHRKLGINLKDAMGHTEAESLGLLEKRPWLMVAPMMSVKNEFVQNMKSKYGAVTIGFSGWADSRFPYAKKCDYSIPMSDHCDFGELVQMIKKSRAEKIYTIHGFVKEFADELKQMGFDAEPLH